jgi:hypothetical protein
LSAAAALGSSAAAAANLSLLVCNMFVRVGIKQESRDWAMANNVRDIATAAAALTAKEAGCCCCSQAMKYREELGKAPSASSSIVCPPARPPARSATLLAGRPPDQQVVSQFFLYCLRSLLWPTRSVVELSLIPSPLPFPTSSFLNDKKMLFGELMVTDMAP